MALKSFKKNKNQLKGKTVFLRLDYNVPLNKNKISEDFKIKQSLKTIELLLKNDNILVLASHLGRPSSYDKNYSLKVIAQYLEKNLKIKIRFLDFPSFNKFESLRQELRKREYSIYLLDNLRFYPREEKNCKRLAKSFASLADVYVNDAFAVSHRANSSVAAIRSYLPAYQGLLLEEELEKLNRALKAKKPFVLIMGGAKISTKLPIIEKLYKKASYILLGGALANNFYLAQGYNLGQSLVDKKELSLVKGYLNSRKIILPSDLVVESKIGTKRKISAKSFKDLDDNDRALDIGPESILLFSQYIKKAQTIIWNGPMGMFENSLFNKGTITIAREVALRSKGSAFGVAGGGETVEALKLTKLENYMDWVSTGGGAMLAYLAGEKMPGLD